VNHSIPHTERIASSWPIGVAVDKRLRKRVLVAILDQRIATSNILEKALELPACAYGIMSHIVGRTKALHHALP
jgi:hypothetical protein